MVRESFQTLSYDDLSARESEPEAVTASVPIGDVVQFVQMLARNPLMATPNARALKNIAGDLRDRQSQEMLAAFRYVLFPCVGCVGDRPRRFVSTIFNKQRRRSFL